MTTSDRVCQTTLVGGAGELPRLCQLLPGAPSFPDPSPSRNPSFPDPSPSRNPSFPDPRRPSAGHKKLPVFAWFYPMSYIAACFHLKPPTSRGQVTRPAQQRIKKERPALLLTAAK